MRCAAKQRDANGGRTGFQYKLWSDDSVEHYDAAGRLLRVAQRNGWTNTLTYSDASTVCRHRPASGPLDHGAQPLRPRVALHLRHGRAAGSCCRRVQ